MVNYQGIFLEEIKALLPCFVKLKEDNIFLSKEYPDDCIIKGWNQQPIIIITYNESIFFANNSRWKV